MILASGSYVVQPNVGLIVLSIYVVFALLAGVLTAGKGRWGWFWLGVFTGGLLWIVGAFQTPSPTSIWARLQRAR
jgi:hypothetical protein